MNIEYPTRNIQYRSKSWSSKKPDNPVSIRGINQSQSDLYYHTTRHSVFSPVQGEKQRGVVGTGNPTRIGKILRAVRLALNEGTKIQLIGRYPAPYTLRQASYSLSPAPPSREDCLNIEQKNIQYPMIRLFVDDG